ncbi:hypothetical protein HK102_002177, partial [Quaeritorhiza haematococci]
MVSFTAIRTFVLCGFLALSQVAPSNAAPAAQLETTNEGPAVGTVPLNLEDFVQKIQDATNKIKNAVPALGNAGLDLEDQRRQFQELYNSAQNKLQALSNDIPSLQILQQPLREFEEAVMQGTAGAGIAGTQTVKARLAKRQRRRRPDLSDVLD